MKRNETERNETERNGILRAENAKLQARLREAETRAREAEEALQTERTANATPRADAPRVNRAEAKGGTAEMLDKLFLMAVAAANDNEATVAVRKFRVELANCGLDAHDIKFEKLIDAKIVEKKAADSATYRARAQAKQQADMRERMSQFASRSDNRAILEMLSHTGGATITELYDKLQLRGKNGALLTLTRVRSLPGGLREDMLASPTNHTHNGETVWALTNSGAEEVRKFHATA